MDNKKKKPFSGGGGDNASPFDFVPRPTDMLDFQGTFLPTRFINKVMKFDTYCTIKSRPMYKIIINPDGTEKQFLNNAEAVFYDWDEREEFLKAMKQQLYGCNIQFTEVFPSA